MKLQKSIAAPFLRYIMNGAALLAIGGFLAPLPALATVDFFGSVNPNPPVSGGSQSGTIIVGDQGDDDDSLFGYLEINNGTDLQYDQMIIGDEDDTVGDVVVTGTGSTLTLDATSAASPALRVGETGTGFLTVLDGAVVDISDFTTASGSNGTMTVGEDSTGAGYVEVSGRLTRLYVGDNLIVGESGYGELKVTNDAFLFYRDPDDGTLVIGEFASGTGLVHVDGGAFFQAPETITVGTVGAGTLRVTGGANFDAANGYGGAFTVGGSGLVELAGGSNLMTDAITVTGRIKGDGLVTGAVTVSPGGEIQAGPGEKLQFTGAVANAGLVNIAGTEIAPAEIEFGSTLTNTDPGAPDPPGRVAVGSGVVRFNTPVTNDGVLASTSGVTDFHGEITNGATGLIAIGGASHATFYDTVDITAGTLNIAAGSTALFLADITISPGATLEVVIDETAATESFATPLQSTGLLTLDAPVTLVLSEGFVPEAGDAFPLVEAAGGLALGVIEPNNFEPLPAGLAWNVLVSNDGLTALVVADGGIDPGNFLEGDYNQDGAVDSADYALWRNTLGQVGQGLPADGDGSGVVDAFDYQVWKLNYGAVAGAGAGSEIPEPSALCLLLVALLPAGFQLRR